MRVPLVQNILKANDRIASENKALFDKKGILVEIEWLGEQK